MPGKEQAPTGNELLRTVELLHREKNISKDVIFEGIEAAVRQAAERYYDDDEQELVVNIDRSSGVITARRGEKQIAPEELGRIAASSAKQAMIQKIREAECNAVFDKFTEKKFNMIQGTVQRFEGGAATVSIDVDNIKAEAILPRGEQIPGETHHVNERVKAVIFEVRKAGHRVKIILSRTHPEFVRRLFEKEIPEIEDRTIEIKALAREAGYRTKIAVSSIDLKVDCVGACVGVRGSRIKNIVDELGGERIDIVRWNDSLQVMIPNALQPAQIEEVFLYPRLGRAIVLVKEDQLSLAIGRRGQNVRLASKLVGWDIEIMTHDELTEGVDRAEGWFRQIPNVTDEMVEAFIEEGFLSYDDLTFLEPAQLAELAAVTEDQAEEMIAYAEEASDRVAAETQAAKAAEAEARAAAPQAPQRPSPAAAAANLFREDGPQPVEEAPKPTLESLFGPDPTAKPVDPALSAAQVFGEKPPAETVDKEEHPAPETAE